MRKHILPAFFLLALVVTIIFLNTPSRVFLTGWDNLHPEFNLPLNIFRSIFSVWEEYQGVGLLAGMGYGATIFYQLIMLPFSFIFPLNLLRFLWTYFMLFLGPLGMYFLLHYIFGVTRVKGSWQRAGLIAASNTRPSTDGVNERQDPNIFFRSDLSTNVISLLGALFYLLNLSTLQAFYAPLEVFTTHFGFLPWFFLTTIRYFNLPSKKNLLFFSLVLILGMAQGYVPTVFFVYLLSILILLTILCINNQTSRTLFSAVKMLFVIFVINAFWLLPFAYFTVTSSHIPVAAKINQMSTESILWQNKEFGHLWDVMLLKGFWFNNLDPSNAVQRMMLPWINHLDHWYMWLLGFFFFSIILVGFFAALKGKTPISFAIVLLFLISITALTTATPPFSFINDLFRTHLPLVNQVLRFPFTKFSILASFTYSILFAFGLTHLTQRVNNRLNTFIYLLMSLFLIIFMFPIFQGHLFYEKELIPIPKDYFSLFSYFQNQDPNTRIADLPQNTFWSWPFYTWGYQGSGFLWYGIPQPILDRAFDPWSSNNENYYWELSQALYSQDTNAFADVLNKYQISWLIVDKNQYNPVNPLLFLNPNLEDFLKAIPGVKKETSFGNILVYKIALTNQPQNFVFVTPKLSTTNTTLWNNTDTFYNTYGNYISTNSNANFFYPFSALFSQHPLSFSLSQTTNSIIFETKIPSTQTGVLHIPDFSSTEATLPFSITLTPPANIDTYAITSPSSKIQIQNGTDNLFRAEIKKIIDPFLTVSIPAVQQSFTTDSCDTMRKGTMNIAQQPDSLLVSSFNATACLSLALPYLPHTVGYALFVTANHIEGRPLHLWVSNPKENFLPIDLYLPNTPSQQTYSFILPPLENFTSSYLLQLENISIANSKTINDVGSIAVYPIPYDFLKNIYISDFVPSKISPLEASVDVSHQNPSIYTVTINTQRAASSSTLVLSQAYDLGWHAYETNSWIAEAFPFFFGTEIKSHLKVNSWENGWILNITDSPISHRITVLYLPQYLEYGGFLLLVIFLSYLLFTSFVTRA